MQCRASLLPGMTQYPLCRWLGGPQVWSGWVQKFLPCTRIWSPDCLACSKLLYWLCYPDPFNNWTSSYIIGAVPFYSISFYMFKQNSLPVLRRAQLLKKVSVPWSSGSSDEIYNLFLEPATGLYGDHLIPVHTATCCLYNIQFTIVLSFTDILPPKCFLLLIFST
jgi:hypothetical protein